MFRLVADFIGRSDRLAALDACACHPDRHRARVMIAAYAVLGEGHPAEFGVPEHQSGIQQTKRLQICQQAGEGQVRFLGMERMVLLHIGVSVPGILILDAQPA